MVCADSDFIADLDRGKTAAIAKLDELEARREVVYTTAINIAELYHGANSSRNPKGAIDKIDKIISRFSVLNLDHESAKIWGSLVHTMKSSTIGELDLFIGSIAIANRQSLLTRNVKHFERVPGLTVESW